MEGTEWTATQLRSNIALLEPNFRRTECSARATDITSALAHLVTQSQQKPQTAAGTGLSGARHAQGSGNNLDGCSDDSSAGAALAAGDGGDVREKLDALVDRVKGLRQRTAEATLFLTVYDLRRAQEACPAILILRVLHRGVLRG